MGALAMQPGRSPVRPFYPLSRRSSRFLVGRDATGRWIVSDAIGMAGGVFTDRTAAIHFALVESNYNPGDVHAAPDNVVLSLDAIFEPRSRET